MNSPSKCFFSATSAPSCTPPVFPLHLLVLQLLELFQRQFLRLDQLRLRVFDLLHNARDDPGKRCAYECPVSDHRKATAEGPSSGTGRAWRVAVQSPNNPVTLSKLQLPLFTTPSERLYKVLATTPCTRTHQTPPGRNPPLSGFGMSSAAVGGAVYTPVCPRARNSHRRISQGPQSSCCYVRERMRQNGVNRG